MMRKQYLRASTHGSACRPALAWATHTRTMAAIASAQVAPASIWVPSQCTAPPSESLAPVSLMEAESRLHGRTHTRRVSNQPEHRRGAPGTSTITHRGVGVASEKSSSEAEDVNSSSAMSPSAKPALTASRALGSDMERRWERRAARRFARATPRDKADVWVASTTVGTSTLPNKGSVVTTELQSTPHATKHSSRHQQAKRVSHCKSTAPNDSYNGRVHPGQACTHSNGSVTGPLGAGASYVYPSRITRRTRGRPSLLWLLALVCDAGDAPGVIGLAARGVGGACTRKGPRTANMCATSMPCPSECTGRLRERTKHPWPSLLFPIVSHMGPSWATAVAWAAPGSAMAPAEVVPGGCNALGACSSWCCYEAILSMRVIDT